MSPLVARKIKLNHACCEQGRVWVHDGIVDKGVFLLSGSVEKSSPLTLKASTGERRRKRGSAPSRGAAGGGGSPGQQQPHMPVRVTANARERDRTHSVNSAFIILRQLIPTGRPHLGTEVEEPLVCCQGNIPTHFVKLQLIFALNPLWDKLSKTSKSQRKTFLCLVTVTNSLAIERQFPFVQALRTGRS